MKWIDEAAKDRIETNLYPLLYILLSMNFILRF